MTTAVIKTKQKYSGNLSIMLELINQWRNINGTDLDCSHISCHFLVGFDCWTVFVSRDFMLSSCHFQEVPIYRINFEVYYSAIQCDLEQIRQFHISFSLFLRSTIYLLFLISVKSMLYSLSGYNSRAAKENYGKGSRLGNIACCLINC